MGKYELLKNYRKKSLFQKFDIILLILLVLSIAVSIIFITNPKKGNMVEIYYKGELIETCLLNEDKTIVVEKTGYNKIIIKNGSVFMEDADCPNKLCMKSKPISFVNQRIVCSPNGIVIIIKGNDEIDGITGGNYAG